MKIHRFVHYFDGADKHSSFNQPVLVGVSTVMPGEDGQTVLGSSVEDEQLLRTIRMAVAVLRNTGEKALTVNGLETRVANW